jgi:hypothetical protein
VGAIGDRKWACEFEDPIALPDGGTLVTLLDAGNYIIALPEHVHTCAEWQAAMEALIPVADLGGPTIFARIGIMKALNRHYLTDARPTQEAAIVLRNRAMALGRPRRFMIRPTVL